MATDKEIYGQIANELKTKKIDPALYARAVELAGGDKTKLESIYIKLRAADLKSERRTANVAAAAKSTGEAIDRSRPAVGFLYPKVANGLPKFGLLLGILIAGGIGFFVLLGSAGEEEGGIIEQLNFLFVGAMVWVFLLFSVGGWLAGKALCVIGTTFVLSQEQGFPAAYGEALSRTFSGKRCTSPYEPAPKIQNSRRRLSQQ